MTASFDIVIIGTGAGGGTIAHAPGAERRAHPHSRARRLRPAGSGELEPGGSLEEAPLPDDRVLDRRRTGASSGPTRTTTSAGTRSSGAACSTGCGARTSRRPSTREGVSPAWPIDYDTLAPYYDRAEQLYRVRGEMGDDPTEPPHGPYPLPAVPHAPRHGAHRVAAARAGAPSLVAAARLLLPGRSRRLRPLQHLQLVRLPHAREERRRCLAVRPAAARQRHALDERVRPPSGHDPSGRARGCALTSNATARPCASRRRSSIVACGAVNSAALLLRSATHKHPDGLANSSGLVGRSYMAHLATMMQAFHLLDERRRCSRRPSRSTTSTWPRPTRPYPLGRSSRRGGPPWRDGADRGGGGTRDALHSGVGLRAVGLARDSTGSP